MQRGLYFKGADRCELGEDRMERNGAICYLVGAGRLCGPHFSPEKEDLVIAADGGYTHLQELGIRTDLLIGDMDSLSGAVPEGVRVLPFKPEKNDTDMALSAAYALTEGFQRIRIYGGSGGRFDHTLANLQLYNSGYKRLFEISCRRGRLSFGLRTRWMCGGRMGAGTEISAEGCFAEG